MKVYFTLTDGVENSPINLDMLNVALKSARENTSLKLYALYDGTVDDKAYKIFKANGVNITLCKCSFADKLEYYYEQSGTENLRLSTKRMLGCFMKFDISLYEKEDEVVLYSDIDTMFMKDAPWDSFNIKRLGVAPEFEKDYDIIKGYRYFSAGIMMINVPELRKRREKLFEMLDNKIEPYQECWDQGFWNELYKDDFEELGLEFNWKPYWGINKNASIIHIHGFKPFSITKSDFDFVSSMLLRFSDAHIGWIYYFSIFCKYLGEKSTSNLDTDKYLADFSKFLAFCSTFNNPKQWKASTFVCYHLYKMLKKSKYEKLFSKILNYLSKKLKKRKIYRKENLFDEITSYNEY